jgi:tetratricopeptide (TPR) repeat protein/TolB-like protein
MASHVSVSNAVRPPAEQVLDQLDRILRTPGFTDYPRTAALLKYVVEETLAGRAEELKESTIGIEVFGRDPGYDSKVDSIVRTQARRLREKLRQYYDEAADDPIQISIPKGGYVPEFQLIHPLPARPAQRPAPRIWAVAAAAAVLIAIVVALSWRRVAAREVSWPAIAVLPFANLDPSHPHDTLIYGMTEDLERDLSHIKNLRIHATPPAVQLTTAERSDYIALSRKLAVEALVDGTVDASGIRVSLIRASDGTILWAGSFAVDEPIGGVERRIESGVSKALGMTLPAGASSRPENPKAHDLFFAGRTLWATREAGKTREAIGLFEQALAIDPNYALAYMGIADAYALMVSHAQIDSKIGLERGEAAARKALELDPALAEAHAALGLIVGQEGHMKEAETEYLRAIELNPSYDRAYAREGTLKFSLGDFPAAERLLRESERLNPYAMSLPLIRAEIYYNWRRYKDSEDLIRQVQTADPDNTLTLLLLARDQFAEHHPEQAVETERKAIAERPDELLYKWEMVPYLYASGHREEAARLLDYVQHPPTGDPVNALALAGIYGRIGDKEKTLSWLDQAWKDRITEIPSIRWDPVYDPIRDDPRYKALLAKIVANTE